MPNESDLREEGIRYLQQLSETQLKDEVIKPLFGKEWAVGFDRWERRKKWLVLDVDRKSELEHRCDLILSSIPHHGELLVGIQLKAWNNGNNDINAGKYVVTKIRPCAEAALRDRYRNGARLSKYYWITTGYLAEPSGRKAVEKFINTPESTGGRVEVWDVGDLYDRIVNAQSFRDNLDKTANDVVKGLQINAIRRQVEKHMQDGEGSFAALLAYAALRGCLLRQTPDIPTALACATVGLAALRQDSCRNIYYHRVLRNVLEAWEELLLAHPKELQKHVKNLLEGSVAVEECAIYMRDDGIDRLELILDFDCIFRQLRQLEKHYVNGPSGLSTLKLSRLLLRSGFSPTDREISERLKRAQEDLKKEGGKSIDGECCLCTGAAVSCLALARNRDVGRPVEWLLGLAPHRYCYHGAAVEPYNHSLHYPASVLQAFVDLDPGYTSRRAEEIAEIFFDPAASKRAEIVRYWMLYRHEHGFNIYHDILLAFLRFFLVGRQVGELGKGQLRKAIQMLVSDLEKDCKEVQSPWKLYAARENLSSFCLGLVLEVEESYEFVRQIARLFRYRARRIAKEPTDLLLDSNVDITMAFLEGYLDYWETLFYLKEDGRSIEHLLPALQPPEGSSSFMPRARQDNIQSSA